MSGRKIRRLEDGTRIPKSNLSPARDLAPARVTGAEVAGTISILGVSDLRRVENPRAGEGCGAPAARPPFRPRKSG